MSKPGEKIYTKKEAMMRLGMTETRYRQLIESGILPRPVALTPGARAVHIEAHFVVCERNLHERMMSDYDLRRERDRQNGYKPTKPITLKPGETLR